MISSIPNFESTATRAATAVETIRPVTTPVFGVSEKADSSNARTADQAEQVVEDTPPEGLVRTLDEWVSKTQADLKFRVDDISGKVVVSIVHTKTGEVIRQIPSEEAMKIAHRVINASSGSSNSGLVSEVA